MPYRTISGVPDTAVVAASGDMAYFVGRSRLVLDVAGEEIESVGKYLGVWQHLGGRWKLAAISWSSNEAVE